MPGPDTARLFQDTAVHDDRKPLPRHAARLADTVAMVPAGAASVLDVGCGPGDLLRRLDAPVRIGTDLATRGMRRAGLPVARASVLSLPFADASFDVVVCAETLEHLDPPDLRPAADELMRVARRHVLVTVPNREQLLLNSHRCPRCGTVFHLHGHQSSLGEGDVRALFPGARAFDVRGSWRERPFSPALLRLRTETLGLWKHTAHTLCPRCGNRQFENHERRVAYWLVHAANLLLHPRKTRFNWILVLVEKAT